MKKQAIISNSEDIRRILDLNNISIFGLGEYPSSRSEIHFFTPNLEVICEKKTGEFESIKENIPVVYFPKSISEKNIRSQKAAPSLRDERIISHIRKRSKNKKIALYIYKSSPKIEMICKKYKWKTLALPTALYHKFSDKLEFYKILKELRMPAQYTLVKFRQLESRLPDLFKKYGNKIVIQFLYERGGRGTFFFNRKDKEKIVEEIKNRLTILNKKGRIEYVTVSRFVDGPSLSITGCITKSNGILTSYCQYQLIDISEVSSNKIDATGIFCGHDWSLSNNIPLAIHKKAQNLIEKLGNKLKKRGVLGIFGLDLIWDKINNRLVPLEINPRLLGTFPAAVYVQIEKKEIPLIAFHILDFLNIPYKIKSGETYRKELFRHGAHIILHNPEKYDVICQKQLRGGVYALNKNRLRYLRSGSELSDIESKNEFIITEGGPIRGRVYRRDRRLLRIITKRGISKLGGKILNDWGKIIVKSIYKELDLRPHVED
jgi:predicted ATP-grasp superfamily ATP-dependent carboligase